MALTPAATLLAAPGMKQLQVSGDADAVLVPLDAGGVEVQGLELAGALDTDLVAAVGLLDRGDGGSCAGVGPRPESLG